MSFEKDVRTLLRLDAHTRPENATPAEWYQAISQSALAMVAPKWKKPSRQKRAAYFSAEFLVGRLIDQNIFNLGIRDNVYAMLHRQKSDRHMFEDIPDAALGNGGLGRLAACYLESAATRDIPLDGYGIRYRYGLFRQVIEDGFQKEFPDDWLKFGDPWSRRREDERVKVTFGDGAVWAVPYDTPVIGYGAGTVNNLRLWQAEAICPFDFSAFNDQEYDLAVDEKNRAERLSSVLYPNDSTDAGKTLRLKQQYFFASASVQDILRRCRPHRGKPYSHLADDWAIQLNDTHPVVAIPELIRLLCEDGVTFTRALNIARSVFAYTNHTVLPEALETWDVRLFQTTLPHIYPYILQLNKALLRELKRRGIERSAVPDYAIVSGGRIHMARLAIFASHAVNGVARLHSELLKTSVLPEWYALYPDRFQNKTNGITQRLWLAIANPELSALITERIGSDWINDLPQLRDLERFADDKEFLDRFAAVKSLKKKQFSEFALKKHGITVRIDGIYDVQAKRLHEYKRQLLNAFCIMDTCFGLKDGRITDFSPTVYIFAAKAAPGYLRAKAIIKYICALADMIDKDPVLSSKMQVIFLPDYNVSAAEYIIPAADVSEQISLAGTEASGTGNMKFMLNGAVTLGTYDGANVEIVEQAGRKNNYIFGLTAEQVAAARTSHSPKEIAASDERIGRVIRTLIDGTLDDGDTGMFRELYDSLMEGSSWHEADQYLLLADFHAYCDARLQTNRDWKNRRAFTQKCLLNTAAAGYFSSDRSVEEYAADIWNI